MYWVWYEGAAGGAVGEVASGWWRVASRRRLVRVKIGREADSFQPTAVKREAAAEVEKGTPPGFFI